MRALSLALDGQYLRLVLVEKEKKDNYVLLLTRSIKRNLLKNNGDILSWIENLLETESLDGQYEVVISLSPKVVHLKSLSFPFRSRAKIAKLLPFQLADLPMDLASSSYATQYYDKQHGGADVNIYSVSGDNLTKSINECQIDPQWVGVDAQSLNRFIQHSSEKGVDGILHIGFDHSSLVLLEGDRVVKQAYIPFGATCFASNIETYRITDFIESGANQFALHLARLIDHIQEDSPSIKKLRIVSLGYGVEWSPLDDIEQIESLRISNDKNEVLYGKEIGAALDVLRGDKMSVQLRSGKWLSLSHYSDIKKQLKKIAVGMVATCSIGFAGLLIYQNRQLSSLEFETKQALCKAALHEDTIHVESRSIGDFRKRVRYLDARYRKQNHFYSDINGPILVSDLLDWIGGIELSGSIDSFRYELIKYPSASQSKEPFMAQVTVKLTKEEDAYLLLEAASQRYSDGLVKEILKNEKETKVTLQFS